MFINVLVSLRYEDALGNVLVIYSELSVQATTPRTPIECRLPRNQEEIAGDI